jgi:hypothetical protein
MLFSFLCPNIGKLQTHSTEQLRQQHSVPVFVRYLVRISAGSPAVMIYFMVLFLTRGYAVVQLVEVLRYKPEGRGFDSRWCRWNFLLT